MASAFVHNIGTANPETKISQEDALRYLINSFGSIPKEEQRKLNAVFGRSGISQRYTVVNSYQIEENFLWGRSNGEVPWTKERMELFKESATQLAESSIEALGIKELNNPALITVSCTGLMAPGLEILLSQRLGFNPDSLKMGVNFMGCYGTFHAWKIAESQLKSGLSNEVLITSVELCSIHFQRSLKESDILGNALFGDGSGSCFMSTSRPEKGKYLELLKTGNHLFYEGNKDLKWDVSNTGFEMVLTSSLPGIIKNEVSLVIKKFLDPLGISTEEIQHYAIHPGGKRILDEFESALNLDSEKIKESRKVLRQHGNMSSASILFVLDEIVRNMKNQGYILGIAFGPGFTIELALFKAHV